MDFVEICNVCTRKVIIKAARKTFNSDKICRSYCDFYFGVTFLEHTVDDVKEGKGDAHLRRNSLFTVCPIRRGFSEEKEIVLSGCKYISLL